MDLFLYCVILCASISGVWCYDYNISGLVVSSMVAFFLIIPIIGMLFMLVQWRDWYERKQAEEGRHKLPREHWTIFPKREKRTPTRASSLRSDRKPIKMHNIMYTPTSRQTTLSQQQEQPNFIRMAPPPVVNKYEEKTQTLQFEPEEEAVVIAEILPDPQQGMTTAYRQSQERNESSQNQNSYRISKRSDEDGQTTYVSLSQKQPSQYLRQTAPARAVQPKPYHVQLRAADYTTETAPQTTTPATSYTNPLSQTTVPRPSTSYTNPLSQTTVPRPSTSYVNPLSQTTVPSTSGTQVPRLSQTIATTNNQGDSVFIPQGDGRSSPEETGTAVFTFNAENDDDDKLIQPGFQSEDVVLF